MATEREDKAQRKDRMEDTQALREQLCWALVLGSANGIDYWG